MEGPGVCIGGVITSRQLVDAPLFHPGVHSFRTLLALKVALKIWERLGGSPLQIKMNPAKPDPFAEISPSGDPLSPSAQGFVFGLRLKPNFPRDGRPWGNHHVK